MQGKKPSGVSSCSEVVGSNEKELERLVVENARLIFSGASLYPAWYTRAKLLRSRA
jgi:hypothetical protein